MRLSIVIPIYNEAKTIPYLVSALRSVLEQLECEYEVVFVDDGSEDQSLSLLERAAQDDFRLKVFAFSRNFGHQAAITAGLDFAEGDAVAVMDADLQDPPEVLGEMLALYQQGYDVVSAQRVHRDGDGVFKRATARLFYWLMKSMVDERLIPQVGDFRLFSREALVAIRSFREQHRFVRGLVSWLGLKEAIVPFTRRSRVAGETKYPLYRMLRFAWTAISSFSALPLRVSTALGLSMCAGGFLYFFYALYRAYVSHAVIPGWTSIVALQCIFSGVTLLSLGLVGDYVARIYEESKNRPLYVVSRVVNTSIRPGEAQRAVVLPRCQRAPAPDGEPLASAQTEQTARKNDLEVLSEVLVKSIEP
jgi:polyisoprenyl-phosphate glycosyltransferase